MIFGHTTSSFSGTLLTVVVEDEKTVVLVELGVVVDCSTMYKVKNFVNF